MSTSCSRITQSTWGKCRFLESTPNLQKERKKKGEREERVKRKEKKREREKPTKKRKEREKGRKGEKRKKKGKENISRMGLWTMHLGSPNVIPKVDRGFWTGYSCHCRLATLCPNIVGSPSALLPFYLSTLSVWRSPAPSR